MSNFLLFTLLTMLTGSPLVGLLVVLAIWWLGDRATFQVLPDPFRWGARWRRRGQLRRALETNPSDRRARFELADLWLEAGRPAEAVATLRPNIEAGDDDVHTAHLWGTALGRSGAHEAAEKALAVARAAEPCFRAGELDLELGRQRLERGDLAGAREALERLLELRPGTVEGRWYLARALTGLGDQAGAERRRQEAWSEYLALPAFRRRSQRRFAWRIKPWRPALVGLAVLGAIWLAASAFGP
jgi:tetratricopeptide (TPR) repeat protein